MLDMCGLVQNTSFLLQILIYVLIIFSSMYGLVQCMLEQILIYVLLPQSCTDDKRAYLPVNRDYSSLMLQYELIVEISIWYLILWLLQNSSTCYNEK